MNYEPTTKRDKRIEIYCVEQCEPGIYQSVFPSPEAEKSQLHSSIQDAIDYIKECRGANVHIVVQTGLLKGVQS